MIDAVKIRDGYRLYMVEAENMANPQMWIGKELPLPEDTGCSLQAVIDLYLKENDWLRYTLVSGTEFFGPRGVGGTVITRDDLIERIWKWLEQEYDFDLFEDWSSFMYESDR